MRKLAALSSMTFGLLLLLVFSIDRTTQPKDGSSHVATITSAVRRLSTDSSNYKSLAQLYREDGSFQISRDYKLVYIHIPKTGGSTIEESALFDEKRKVGGAARSHNRVSKVMANAVERRLTNFTTAATIRQPCERFMSAFHYAKKPNNAQKGVRMRQKFLIDEFDDVSEWVAWLEKSRLWDDLRGQWSHFMPMWYWLMYDDKTFGIDVVMCQEHWNEGIHRLSKAINRQVPDSVLSHKNGALHPSCDALDIATRERIMKAYELDACLFGYQDDLLPIKAPNERPTCIGNSRTTMFFTRRFRDCHNMLYGTTYV